jgi:hypothetical protein
MVVRAAFWLRAIPAMRNNELNKIAKVITVRLEDFIRLILLYVWELKIQAFFIPLSEYAETPIKFKLPVLVNVPKA